MPDMLSYLEGGVMPGHWVTPHMPHDIERELEEGALDFADELILGHRAKDRLFDAMCAEGSHLWQPLYVPFDEVRVGSRVILAPTPFRRDTIDAQVTSFSERHGLTEVGTTHGTFRPSEWNAACRVLVPIPADLSTLGLFAASLEHRG